MEPSNSTEQSADLFKTKNGLAFPGVSLEKSNLLRHSLVSDYGMTWPQLCEAASYSMAMVVRYALGLTALGGQTFVIAADTPAGWSALACLRHLVTAGAQGGVIITDPIERLSPDYELQVKPLQGMGVEFVTLKELLGSGQTEQLVANCHNLICGIFNPEIQKLSPEVRELLNLLNEASTPVHCIEAPPGIDVESGKPSEDSPLFASSTLSIGAPYCGLLPGNDYVGRHYLCDISIPASLYKKHAADLTPLFAEQPVVQIFPAKAASE